MRELQSSIAGVTSTVEAALKRQSDESVLPNIFDALQAIEGTALASKNTVKKQLDAFDRRIVELSTNISALKEELATRGREPDKVATAPEISRDNGNISALREEVSAHAVKLDRAIAIIETQEEMMKTLLDLVQKGSVAAKDDMVRLHTHFNGVAARIAFVDSKSSQDATSTTLRPILNDSGHSPPNCSLPDRPMDVDASASELRSAAAPSASVAIPYWNETPAVQHDDHSDVLGIQTNVPTASAPAMIPNSPPVDSVAVTSTIVGESRTPGFNGVTVNAVRQSPSPDTVKRLMTVTANRTPPDVVSDTTAVTANGSQNTVDVEMADAAPEKEHSNGEEDVAFIAEKSRSAEMTSINITALHQCQSAGCDAQVVTTVAKGTSPDAHPDKNMVIEKGTSSILHTEGLRVAEDTEGCGINEDVDEDVARPEVEK